MYRWVNITEPSEDLEYFTNKYGWSGYGFRKDGYVRRAKMLDFMTVYHVMQNNESHNSLLRTTPPAERHMIIPKHEISRYNKAIWLIPTWDSGGRFVWWTSEWVTPDSLEYSKIRQGQVVGIFDD